MFKKFVQKKVPAHFSFPSVWGEGQGKKEHTPPPRDPSFLGLSPDPEVTAKNAMVYTIFLGKQGKRVYTIGPERRVYTIERQTRKKKKRRVSTEYFFLP